MIWLIEESRNDDGTTTRAVSTLSAVHWRDVERRASSRRRRACADHDDAIDALEGDATR